MGENVGGVSGIKNTVYCSFSEPRMGALKNCLLRPHVCALHVVLLTCPCAMSSLPCAFFSGATCALGNWEFSQASKLSTWATQHAFVRILWVSGSGSPQIATMQFFGSYDLQTCLPDERKYMIFIHHEFGGDWWMQLSSTLVWSYRCDLSFERIDVSLLS